MQCASWPSLGNREHEMLVFRGPTIVGQGKRGNRSTVWRAHSRYRDRTSRNSSGSLSVTRAKCSERIGSTVQPTLPTWPAPKKKRGGKGSVGSYARMVKTRCRGNTSEGNLVGGTGY